MLKKIAEGNVYVWLAFHFILGILAGINSIFVIAWLYIIIFNTLSAAFTNKGKVFLPLFFSYYIPFEVFGRMLKLTPYIPQESGKYLCALFLILGLVYKLNNTGKFKINKIGAAIVFLCMPSIVLMSYEGFWDNLVFAWFGIFDLGLFVIFFSNFVFSKEEIIKLFRMMVLPVITMCSYLIFNTLSISKIEYTVGANAAAAGNFGPNQVASSLGIGIFILAIALIMNYRLYKLKIIDIALLLIIVFRCLLTVTRGGAFSAVLGILPVYFLGKTKGVSNQFAKKIFTMIVICAGVYFMFQFVNKLSGNVLAERYTGETLDTQSGDKEADLETQTDGRSGILFAELEIFSRHPIFGVGPGQCTDYWNEFDIESNTASHTEFTRLLAEHGLFGLIIDILLFYSFFDVIRRRRRNKDNFAYFFNFSFLIFALSMCAHSAMRTMITPFFFGLGFAGIHVTKVLKVKDTTPQLLPDA
ncbi:MAG: O-antigen ligase family protein [Taibaiella sp.]|nr:O-antigen ligase family protein [Taibaiella sp.]